MQWHRSCLSGIWLWSKRVQLSALKGSCLFELVLVSVWTLPIQRQPEVSRISLGIVWEVLRQWPLVMSILVLVGPLRENVPKPVPSHEVDMSMGWVWALGRVQKDIATGTDVVWVVVEG